MERYYFTFGMGQPNQNCYHVIVGTYDEAREKMNERFNRVWGFQYSEGEWMENGISQAERYNLTEIE